MKQSYVEFMTQNQLMRTRLRQVQIELEKIGSNHTDRAKKLRAEEDILFQLIHEGAELEGENLEILKRAIKNNESPVEL